MKKIISVFLAALMLMACVSVTGFATEASTDKVCNCTENHIEVMGECKCCVYCIYVDKGAIKSCYKSDIDKYCCGDCNGMVHCGCDCECCTLNEDLESSKPTTDQYITEQDKEEIVNGFQAVLKKISDFFDMLFDKIFEFLRVDEVLGK